MLERPMPLADRRVLVVEDEYFIAIETTRWLQAAGAAVLGPVPSVQQALDLVEDHDIDAAVLDINLGDGDRVYPVADRLDAIGVPYVFATGDLRSAGVYGDRPRLEKPYLEVELVRAVAGLLRDHVRG